MELDKLKGSIIGIVSSYEVDNKKYNNYLVKDIIGSKVNEALKMVDLANEKQNEYFQNLSSKDQNKVILASMLNEKIIVLYDFTKGMNNKDLTFFKNLFKKIASYNRKIILFERNANFFFNLVDYIYVIKNEKIVFETTSVLDEELYDYIERPPLIEFVYLAIQKGIKLDYYEDFNDLLKAIYRLKA